MDNSTLKDITEHGCASVAPSGFTYYYETTEFFNLHEEGIEDYFYELLGEDWLSTFTKDVESFKVLKNTLVWAFIESVAQTHIEELEENSTLFTLPNHWASALINGDTTGLEEEELANFELFCDDETQGLTCVDCWEDSSFVKYHDAKDYGILATDCSTFVFIKA